MSAEASVMGFVGAGGIGQELVVAIRKFYYSDVSAILADDHRHRVRHRYRHRLGARPAVRQGCAGMSQLPTPDREQLAGADIPTSSTGRFRARLATPAMMSGALGIFVFGLVDLDFSPARLLSGLHQLGWITLMMIPPDPGSSLPAYLVALGETLSIALLGTTIAAVFALPVSLLAARNIVPSNHLPVSGAPVSRSRSAASIR